MVSEIKGKLRMNISSGKISGNAYSAIRYACDLHIITSLKTQAA